MRLLGPADCSPVSFACSGKLLLSWSPHPAVCIRQVDISKLPRTARGQVLRLRLHKRSAADEAEAAWCHEPQLHVCVRVRMYVCVWHPRLMSNNEVLCNWHLYVHWVKIASFTCWVRQCTVLHRAWKKPRFILWASQLLRLFRQRQNVLVSKENVLQCI